MQTDPVIVEIVTAANLAGIEQAKVGLLGFNASTLGLAAGIGILAFATKSAIDITEAHATALGRVKQASDVSGTSFDSNRKVLEDFIKANQAFIPDNNKAIESFAMLLRSTGSQAMAMDGLRVVMNLAAITNKDWDSSTQAVNLGLQGTGRSLRELGIDISALKRDQENVTVATKDLTKAKAEVEKATREHDQAERRLEEYMVQIGRPGHRATTEELMRRKDAEDKVAETTKNLTLANRELATAQDQTRTTTSLQREVLQQLNEKTKDGANYTNEWTRNTNELKGKWSDMANVWGQAVLIEVGLGTAAVNAFAGTWDKLSKDDAMWGTISKRLTDIATGARGVAGALGIQGAGPDGSITMTLADGRTVRIDKDGKQTTLSGDKALPQQYNDRKLMPNEYIDPVSGKTFGVGNPQEQSGWAPRPIQPASTGSGWSDITAQQNYQLALKQWETTQAARLAAEDKMSRQIEIMARQAANLDIIAQMTTEAAKRPVQINSTIYNTQTADPDQLANSLSIRMRGLMGI